MSSIIVFIHRPDTDDVEYVSMPLAEWEKHRCVSFYHNGSYVLAHYKHPGHIIFSHSSKEHVVMAGFERAKVDLGAVSSVWKDCFATLIAY